MQKFDFDVAVLGGGSAGYAAANTTAKAGMRTALVEGGKELGGLCILRGCMPSKALLYAAEILHLARRADTWGIKVNSAGFDFGKVMRRKVQRIAEFAAYRRQQLEQGRFTLLRANARFMNKHMIALTREPRIARGQVSRASELKSPAGKLRPREMTALTAKHFIIATGSVVSPPPLPGLAEVGYLTSDEALSLKRLPRSLIVLGGGAIACELAQFFARFDVKVTMIQRSPRVLKAFDDDASVVVENVFRREGVKLFTGTQLLNARRDGTRKMVEFEQNGKRLSAKAEEILLALGRSPNTADLGLENAGVRTENGRITSDARMRTSAPHIYAAGDCTGPHDIVHIAIQQAEIAAHNIVRPRQPRRMDYRLLTNVVFTDPQVATVGLTEQAATAKGTRFVAATYPFNDHGKSLIMEALDGFVKLLADPQTGEILGGCCVGPMAGELIHEITAAMTSRMTAHELAAMPHYHPTLAEIWTYPAEELAEKISAGLPSRKKRVRG